MPMPLDKEATVISVGLYFDAYLVPIRQGEGRVDSTLLEAASRVRLADPRLSQAYLHQLVAEAIEAAIGFDLVFPFFGRPYRDPGRGRGPLAIGNVRGTPPDSIAIVEAFRKAMLDAIRERNLNAIAPPLADFWARHPDFRPNHTGRLYPHGHEGDEDLVPLAAQTLKLELLLMDVLNDGQPVCGNDVVEEGEQCDGSEDDVCGAFTCRPDCICDGVIDD